MGGDWNVLSVEKKLDGGSGAGDTELRPFLEEEDGGTRSENSEDDGANGGADEGTGGSGDRESAGENESPKPFEALTKESPNPVDPFESVEALCDPVTPASSARNRSPVDVVAAAGTTGRVGRPRRIGEMLTLRSGGGALAACDPVVMIDE